jgi:hypothetical protein
MTINTQKEAENIASLMKQGINPPKGYAESLYGHLTPILELVQDKNIRLWDYEKWLVDNDFWEII